MSKKKKEKKLGRELGTLKFIRREDLTFNDRIELALKMTRWSPWGMVTELSEQFGVSREFLYKNLSWFNSLSINEKPEKFLTDEMARRLILCLRLHCGSSIEGVVATFREMNWSPNSAGYVSEFLRYVGERCAIEIPSDLAPVVLLLDETFTGNSPILVVMEAVSHYILAIFPADDRKAETWVELLLALKKKGVEPSLFVKDQGASLKAAAKALGVQERADLFHLLKPFDPPIGGFERRAYGWINEVERRVAVFDNRKSEKALLKSLEQYENAMENMGESVCLYDDYDYLHKCLHESFNSFNNDGTPKSVTEVKMEMEALMELIEERFGEFEKICAAVKFLRGNLDDYWSYFEQLTEIVGACVKTMPESALTAACLSWQLARKAMAVKNQKLKRQLAAESNIWRELALQELGEEDVLNKVFVELDANVRSSSPLEAINSIIRRYLDSFRGQVTQASLNMIACHINSKQATRGKYKGTSAYERWTGDFLVESSIEMLMRKCNLNGMRSENDLMMPSPVLEKTA